MLFKFKVVKDLLLNVMLWWWWMLLPWCEGILNDWFILQSHVYVYILYLQWQATTQLTSHHWIFMQFVRFLLQLKKKLSLSDSSDKRLLVIENDFSITWTELVYNIDPVEIVIIFILQNGLYIFFSNVLIIRCQKSIRAKQ